MWPVCVTAIRECAMSKQKAKSNFRAVLQAGVASAVLIAFAIPASAGGVNVSVGGHSVVSIPGGGGAGGVGGAVGGLGGGLSSGLGSVTGGISSGLGGASDGL